MESHDISFGSGGLSSRHRIGVDTYKEVGSGAVGDVGPLIQGNVRIRFAGVNNLYAGYIFFDIKAHLQGDLEGHILFQDLLATGSGVFSAVSCIDNDYIYLELGGPDGGAGGV